MEYTINREKLNYCLIVPRLTELETQTYMFPIGLAYVSSSLKASGRNVVTYNLNYKDGTILELLKPFLEKNDVHVVATGGLTAQYRQIKEIIEAVRSINENIVIVVGGGLITSDPEASMEALETVDYGIVGEGEITMCELAESLEGKNDFSNIPGLVYLDGDIWKITSPRKEMENLDDLPYPDYEAMEYGKLLDKLSVDIFGLGKERIGYISLGRSCPFNCTFCFHPTGSKYRRRGMDSIFHEIDYLIEKFGIQNIEITDELFVTKIESLREFSQKIKERKIGFSIQLRVDMVNREMLLLLRDSGCLSVGFGLESMDPRILKSMKKHITVEQIENALSICHEIGLTTIGNFIFGDQAETTETYNKTLKWWREHPQYTIQLHLITLYPGSQLYKIACAKGVIKDRVAFIKNGCPYVNIATMTETEYREMALAISMAVHERTEMMKNVEIEYLGSNKVSLTAACQRCNRENTWSGVDVFRSLGNLICEHCHRSMYVIAADYCAEIIRENFYNIKMSGGGGLVSGL